MIDRRTEQWINRQIELHTHRLTNRKTDVKTVRWTVGRTDRQNNRWNRQINRQKSDGKLVGQTDRIIDGPGRHSDKFNIRF